MNPTMMHAAVKLVFTAESTEYYDNIFIMKDYKIDKDISGLISALKQNFKSNKCRYTNEDTKTIKIGFKNILKIYITSVRIAGDISSIYLFKTDSFTLY